MSSGTALIIFNKNIIPEHGINAFQNEQEHKE